MVKPFKFDNKTPPNLLNYKLFPLDLYRHFNFSTSLPSFVLLSVPKRSEVLNH